MDESKECKWMQRCPKPVYNEGQAMERVDSKLNWKENINSVLEKKKWTQECIAWEIWDDLESVQMC